MTTSTAPTREHDGLSRTVLWRAGRHPLRRRFRCLIRHRGRPRAGPATARFMAEPSKRCLPPVECLEEIYAYLPGRFRNSGPAVGTGFSRGRRSGLRGGALRPGSGHRRPVPPLEAACGEGAVELAEAFVRFPQPVGGGIRCGIHRRDRGASNAGCQGGEAGGEGVDGRSLPLPLRSATCGRGGRQAQAHTQPDAARRPAYPGRTGARGVVR